MKFISKIFTIILIQVLLITFYSCSKNKSARYYMSALINGNQSFYSTEVQDTITPDSVLHFFGGDITTSASKVEIGFNISHFTTVGTYQVVGNGSYVFFDTCGYIFDTDSGTINVSAISPDIIGTFNFFCSGGRKVTNGSFCVKGP